MLLINILDRCTSEYFMILIPKSHCQILLDLSVRSAQGGVSQLPSHDSFFILSRSDLQGSPIPGRCHGTGQFAALLLILICTFRTQDLLLQENSSWTPKAPPASSVVPTESGKNRLCSSLWQAGIVLFPVLFIYSARVKGLYSTATDFHNGWRNRKSCYCELNKRVVTLSLGFGILDCHLH